MKKILANDGMDPICQRMLEDAGFFVETKNIPQDNLINELNNFDAITVRSATKLRKELIDACPNIKLIGRGGVGMDNIDVDYAKSKGIAVVNTPAASSLSVAELVFSHLFTGVRFLHDSNRNMPLNGQDKFNDLKKNYSKGVELRGKKIGIIGFGRIGREVAKIAIGLGMDVLAFDIFPFNEEIELNFSGNVSAKIKVQKVELNSLLSESDFISIHIPATSDGKPVIGKNEFELMKKGIGLINCARGGVIDENLLIENLDSGKISFAGLDVFENEPTPSQDLLKHKKISLTPHIGASTNEAQERIGIELANLIIQHFSYNA